MKLVVWLTETRRAHTEQELGVLEIPEHIADSYGLEEYGASWARFWKRDIVMLIEEDA